MDKRAGTSAIAEELRDGEQCVVNRELPVSWLKHGLLPHRGLERRLARYDLQAMGIPAPIGLCASTYDDSRLYLASSANPPDANRATVHVLSSHDLSCLRTVEVRNMGHITDSTEDPTTGTIYLVGFRMPAISGESEIQDRTTLHRAPFYEPCFAAIPHDSAGPVEALCLSDVSPGSDVALPLSIICTGTEGG